ncbi:MAG: NAD-dependent epimerase/dehydratase family protein [Candidatus Diapherotrites archaeon]
MKRILVTGSSGQIGSDLVVELANRFGKENVFGADLKDPINKNDMGKFYTTDITNKNAVEALIKKYDINIVYHLAGLLSATGEKMPDEAWRINMTSLKNVLDLARESSFRVFWPSSIAAFGPSTPQENTPQQTILEPATMYGVTKVSGELLCNYYFQKYGVDVRSLRYPGLISYKAEPGGGTTDYAVGIYYGALQEKKYTCFVRENTVLPMMYMPDAINATIDVTEAPSEKIKTRFSYNLAAISFSAKEQEESVKKYIPEFFCTYEPDSRQKIADSWPRTIDDSSARKDWGWKHEYDLDRMTQDMLEKLKVKLGTKD